MFSMAKMDDIKSYKYMSIEEEADFTKRVLSLLENTNYKEIQIYEEKGFTETIGEGEPIYIIEIYEKNNPGFDDLGYAEAVAIMGQEEVKEFEKTFKIENKVEIVWVDNV
ncbi:MAG: hypothetical protein ACXVHW_10550 [Methanobacterium sp.]